MVKARQKTGSITPKAVRGDIAESLVDLRKLIKHEYGIDVDVSVNIHNWPYTFRLGVLASKDMSGGEGWETSAETVPTDYFNGKKNLKTSLTFFRTRGVGDNKGLNITIYKIDGEIIKRPRLVDKPKKGGSSVSRDIFQIRSMIKELYEADAEIKIVARVEKETHSFSTYNSHISIDDSKSFLSSVAVGTNWEQYDYKKWYSEAFGNHTFRLSGPKTQIEMIHSLDSKDHVEHI
ncbi:hypothetical protein [Paenibacillus sp. FSL R7-0333]|uniref:hypothetical protein n=1 Tax=Paenibacillus sp. FSL R7-0333 TaxID=1926587 RepID=UPI00096D743E|nr:hypothetical protein BK146_17020 [Paenibacillus sp. FSL R7-0333]